MEKRQIVVPFMLLMTFAAASAVNAMSIGEAVNAPELDWQTEGVPIWIGESDVLASDGQHHAIARGTVNNTSVFIIVLPTKNSEEPIYCGTLHVYRPYLLRAATIGPSFDIIPQNSI